VVALQLEAVSAGRTSREKAGILLGLYNMMGMT